MSHHSELLLAPGQRKAELLINAPQKGRAATLFIFSFLSSITVGKYTNLDFTATSSTAANYFL